MDGDTLAFKEEDGAGLSLGCELLKYMRLWKAFGNPGLVLLAVSQLRSNVQENLSKISPPRLLVPRLISVHLAESVDESLAHSTCNQNKFCLN